jgi:hypothetical protein
MLLFDVNNVVLGACITSDIKNSGPPAYYNPAGTNNIMIRALALLA